MEALGGRKFIFVMVALIVAGILAFAGDITSVEFVEFVKWLFGIYAAANVAAKFTPESKA